MGPEVEPLREAVMNGVTLRKILAQYSVSGDENSMSTGRAAMLCKSSQMAFGSYADEPLNRTTQDDWFPPRMQPLGSSQRCHSCPMPWISSQRLSWLDSGEPVGPANPRHNPEPAATAIAVQNDAVGAPLTINR